MSGSSPIRRVSQTSSPLNTPIRNPSSTSATTITTTTTNQQQQNSEKKKKARELLRDYYKLSSTTSNTTLEGGVGKVVGIVEEEEEVDELDIDSKTDSFNSSKYFENLTLNSSLTELLRVENELLIEIRDLDGERQSLVYNHHHELIEASDTIKKMKSRAESLDTSLESLKTSFQSLSQLSSSLSSSPCPISSPLPPLSSTTTNSSSITFQPLIHLPPLLSLPILLKSITTSNEMRISLWGTWEPILQFWEDIGILGIGDISRECRDILRSLRGRRISEV